MTTSGQVGLRGKVRLKPDTTSVRKVRVLLASAARVVAALGFVVSGFGRTAAAQNADLDPRIVKLVSEISEQRLEAILKKLESFETRNTLSSTSSATRGIGAAREWI